MVDSNSRRRHPGRIARSVVHLSAYAGMAALIAEPLAWLWRSWWDPSYQSPGAAVGATVLALVVLSLASGPALPDPRARRSAFGLLVASAGLRILGRAIAVNVIGALALVVDVAAVAIALRLSRRPFAISPLALSAFAALALPIEHLLQRLLGHPLQLLATVFADALLGPFFPELARQGTLLVHPEVALAVDLPCSGARGLVLLTGLLTLALCVRRPSRVGLAAGLVAAGGGALVANTTRIVCLFVAARAGYAIGEEPLHTTLGLAALVAGALPLLLTISRWPRRACTRGALRDSKPVRGQQLSLAVPLTIAVLGFTAALWPGHARDDARTGPPPALPSNLGIALGTPVELDPSERRYYAQHGGGAQKRKYSAPGDVTRSVLWVRTDAPLRHLHDPGDCLLGAGHRVTRIGFVAAPYPSIVYRSIDPAGRAWRVEAAFVDDHGRFATGVSEVIWRWLEAPEVAWSLVERVSPWSACEETPGACGAFDHALFDALDWPPTHEAPLGPGPDPRNESPTRAALARAPFGEDA